MSNVKQDPNANGSSIEDTDSQPTYVTKDELAGIVNSAITGHLKRMNVSKQISDALEQSLNPFKEMLSTRAAPEAATAQVADKGPATASGPSPELLAMQKKLELMEKSIKEKEQLIAAKERSAREKDAFAKVSSELSALGVRPEGLDALTKVLRADNKIKVDDDGSISFLADEDNEIDLREGLKAYLDPKVNPMAGLFLPPKSPNTKGKSMPQAVRGSGSISVDDLKQITDPAKRAVLQIQMLNNKSK